MTQIWVQMKKYESKQHKYWLNDTNVIPNDTNMIPNDKNMCQNDTNMN